MGDSDPWTFPVRTIKVGTRPAPRPRVILLIGAGVRAEHLNDDRLGRVLDQLYLSGLTQLFVSIALKAAKQMGVATDRFHLDSSSFHVHGEYEPMSPELRVGGNIAKLLPGAK